MECVHHVFHVHHVFQSVFTKKHIKAWVLNCSFSAWFEFVATESKWFNIFKDTHFSSLLIFFQTQKRKNARTNAHGWTTGRQNHINPLGFSVVLWSVQKLYYIAIENSKWFNRTVDTHTCMNMQCGCCKAILGTKRISSYYGMKL